MRTTSPARRIRLNISLDRARSKAQFFRSALRSYGAQVGFGVLPLEDVTETIRTDPEFVAGFNWAKTQKPERAVVAQRELFS